MNTLKTFYIILFLVLLSACNKKSKSSDSATAVSASSIVVSDSLWHPADSLLIWEYDVKADSMVKTAKVLPDSLNASTMNDLVNAKYTPNVKVEIIRQSQDTLFVKIKESNYLTQQMGSTGAEAFLEEYVYNLSEVPDVQYVHFDFEEGDHASPGTYSR